MKLNSGQSTDSWSGKKIDYFKANKCNWPKGITRWDCIFLFAEELLDDSETCQWQDVENIIFNVVSIVLWPNDKTKPFRSNLRFKKSLESETNKKTQFIQMVNSFAGAETDSLELKASNLLHDLNDFGRL